MDMFSGILAGFQQVMHPMILFYCFMGVLIGTLIGVLPGIGPVGAMSMLLPATFGMSPVVSIIVLAGIYYGSQYGGSTTSILVNVPGEGCLYRYLSRRISDGTQRQGRGCPRHVGLRFLYRRYLQCYRPAVSRLSSCQYGP